MKEQAVVFGASNHLSGVLCEPERPVSGAPAVLLWNVGIHHKVGAYRIWVDLARRLARDGYTSLRFDLSGLGDSEARRAGAEDPLHREDLDDAMAFVTRRTGIATFVPMGFCSGVDQLHALGLRDARVVGMAYIEAWVWSTRGQRLRQPLRYLRGTFWDQRLERLRRRGAVGILKRLLGGREEKLAVHPGEAEAAAGARMFSRQKPSQSDFARDLGALRARGVKMFFAYFGLETGFTHAGQFSEMTGIEPGEGLHLCFLGGADHILYRVEDRAVVIGELAGWMRTQFPEASAAGSIAA